ncbi:MAG TPA: U32 family peptidase [Armatimonadota bacterium]|jgi:putative protease
MTELLAPAGNLERLKWAAEYGADAVYFGIDQFSLRSFAGNFSMEDAQAGLDYLHARGKRGYVTLNVYPFSDEFDDLIKAARTLDEMGADAFIVADLGVLRELSRIKPRAALHISTQANTLNYQTVLTYGELGAKRVNLARELSLEQIEHIQAKLRSSGMETEVFIHGSVCFSYSGRCAISDYLTGRRANRGECTHPCRWNYSLVEEKRPGEYLPVFEDERGLYLFNNKDLALFPFVPALAAAGVASLKIEGRMKNAHYLASVLPVYRAILDGTPMPEEEAWMRLGRTDNRGFSFGFMKGAITPDDYEVESAGYKSTSRWVASTTEEIWSGKRVCRIKNTIHGGETLELLTPDGTISTIELPALITTEGGEVERANNQDTVLMDASLPAYSILRRVKQT